MVLLATVGLFNCNWLRIKENNFTIHINSGNINGQNEILIHIYGPFSEVVFEKCDILCRNPKWPTNLSTSLRQLLSKINGLSKFEEDYMV